MMASRILKILTNTYHILDRVSEPKRGGKKAYRYRFRKNVTDNRSQITDNRSQITDNRSLITDNKDAEKATVAAEHHLDQQSALKETQGDGAPQSYQATTILERQISTILSTANIPASESTIADALRVVEKHDMSFLRQGINKHTGNAAFQWLSFMGGSK